MLNYNSPINETKDFNNLKINEESPSAASDVYKRQDILLPTESNTSTVGNNISALWLSPDEWMIYSNDKIAKNNNTYPIEENLVNNIH